MPAQLPAKKFIYRPLTQMLLGDIKYTLIFLPSSLGDLGVLAVQS
jgi:hypothetical protein